MRIVVTGGAGFIGSALVRHLIGHSDHEVLVIDKLTYAGNLASLASVHGHPRYHFSHTDICDRSAIADVFSSFDPDAVMHLAAESHVDRSIDGPADFINTNVVGTYVLLEAALAHWRKLGSHAQDFRFLHVSTDQVYGALKDEGCFTEETRYDPRSPYSASKAASDHLVRAWSHTYGLPILPTNCSNNYGPHQFPEKLIPLTIIKGLASEPMPVYGRGLNIRDWLFTEETRYDPRSPYSASKAASDHLVRAWSHTYGLPILPTNCSNNYGPHQFPEKLIPLTIIKGLASEPMPVYGRGLNIRDWLFID